MDIPRIDFYVLTSADGRSRAEFCARLCEKALHRNMPVFILTASAKASRALSEVIWSLRPEAFIPNELDLNVSSPVYIHHELPSALPLKAHESLLINLAGECPDTGLQFARVAEIVDQRPDILTATRKHFGAYKAKGLKPLSHTIQ